MMFKNNKIILLTFFIAAFLLSCKTLQEGVIVAVVTHNLHGTLNPSPYRGEFEKYPETPVKKEPPKKEIPVKKEPVKKTPPARPTSGPRYRIELAEAGYTLVISRPIVFAPNEMTMNRRYEESIDIVLEFLSDYTNAKLIVEGHPDKSSDISYDYMVSRVRASSVYDELIDGGTSENRLLFYQNNTRIDNAGVSLKNEAIKFVIINDKDAYAHYLSYLRNYQIKNIKPATTTLASSQNSSPLPKQLVEPKTDNPEKSLVLKSGNGEIIAKSSPKKEPIAKEEQAKKVEAKKEPVAKEEQVKKVEPKKEPVAKEEQAKKVEAKKEPVAKEEQAKKVEPKKEPKKEPSKHTIEKDGTLNLLQPREAIVFSYNSFGIPIRYTNSVNDIILFLNDNTNAKIVIEGYSDKTATSNENLKLSEERGNSLYKALTRSGINENRLLLHGSASDINNPNILIDNNSMRFVIIKDRYDYYNYVKYVRGYKAKKIEATPVIENDKDDNKEKEVAKGRMLKPENNSDIFEFEKKDNGKKQTVAKKEDTKKEEDRKAIAKAEQEKKDNAKKEEEKKILAKAEQEKKDNAKKEEEKKILAKAEQEKKDNAKKEEEPKKVEKKVEAKKAPPRYRIEKLDNLRVLTTTMPMNFKNGSAVIDAKDISSVNAIADIIDFLNDNTNSKLVIEGYGDKTYNSNSNIELSKKRGINTYKVLLSNGIDSDRLLVYGISDIDNSSILMDNDAMKFVVIEDRYAYYDYVKYSREYKPRVSYAVNNVAKEQKKEAPIVEDKTADKKTDKEDVKKVAVVKEKESKEDTKKDSKESKKEDNTKQVAAKETKSKKVATAKIEPEKNDLSIPVGEEKNPSQYKVDKLGNLQIISTKIPIEFKSGSHLIESKSVGAINDIVNFLSYNTNAKIVIEGYSDKTDNINNNLSLSEARGNSVYKALIRSGIDENRLLLHGSNSEINNPDVLIDNNSMRFIVIKDSYDYYNYIKYLREYKSKKVDIYKPVSARKVLSKTRMLNPENNTDIFDVSKNIELVSEQKRDEYRIENLGNLQVISPKVPIEFKSGTSIIESNSVVAISDIIKFLNDNTNTKLIIEGYSDKALASNDNIELSKKRGINIYKTLLVNGINEDRLLVYGISDIDNAHILMDNDGMKFIVIDDKHAYYDYIKYLREYKPSVVEEIINEKEKPAVVESKPIVIAYTKDEAIDKKKKEPIKQAQSTPKKEPAPKKEIVKKEAPLKQAQAKKEVAPKKEPAPKKEIVKKEAPLKQAQAKKEVAPKKEPAPKKETVKKEAPLKQAQAKKEVAPKKEPAPKKEIVKKEPPVKQAQAKKEVAPKKEPAPKKEIVKKEPPVKQAQAKKEVAPKKEPAPKKEIVKKEPPVKQAQAKKEVAPKKEPAPKKETVKKEAPVKQAQAKKEAPTKVEVSKKDEPIKLAQSTPKKAPVKKAPAPKKTPAPKKAPEKKKADTKKASSDEEVVEELPEYIVERVNNINILHPKVPIAFEENISTIPVKHINSINDIIRFMNANTNARLVVEGYGDKTLYGNDKLKLSEERGENIYKLLLRSGIDESRLLLHNRNSDINNTNILMDNNGMRFIVIKDRYDYYNYTKYTREYKSAPDTLASSQSSTDNSAKDIKMFRMAKDVSTKGNEDLFGIGKTAKAPTTEAKTPSKAPAPKKEVVKKEAPAKKTPAPKAPAPKKEVVKKEAPAKKTPAPKAPAPKKEVVKKEAPAKKTPTPKAPAPKKEVAQKKAPAKKEPAPKKTANDTKAKKTPKVEYRVLKSSDLYILLEENPILFDKGSSAINQKAYNKSIDYIVSFLQASTNSKLIIEGYSDKEGTSNQYVSISKARGYSVYEKLLDSGIEKNRLLLYGSNNDMNNAHVLIDNENMRFVIIKDSSAYYDYINYLRRYVPKARPIPDAPKPVQTQMALSSKSIIPLNDPNASIVIITEEEYKKELLEKKQAQANQSEASSKKAPAKKEVAAKKTPAPKKEAPAKKTATKKEAAPKKTPVAKETTSKKEAQPKKTVAKKEVAPKEEETTKKVATKKEAPAKKTATKKEVPPKEEEETTKKVASKKEVEPKKTASSKSSKDTSSSKTPSTKTVLVERKEYRIELSNGLQVLLPPESIAFDYQSAILGDRYKNSISHIADFLKENPEARMVIEGNAYESGTDNYNVVLSRARANSVYNELIKTGIDRNRLLLHSVGNKNVNTNNPTRENRIIRFVIIKNQNDYTRYLDYLKKAGV